MNIKDIASRLQIKKAFGQDSEQFVEWVLLKRDLVKPDQIFKFLERQDVPRKDTAPSKKGLPLSKGEMVIIEASKCKAGHLIDVLKPFDKQIATVDLIEGDDVILKFPNNKYSDLRVDGGIEGPKVGLYRYTPASAALNDERSAKLFEVVYIADENAKPPSADNIQKVQDYIDKGFDKGENRQRCYYSGLVLGIYINKEGEDYFKIFSQQRDSFPRALNPSKGKCFYIGRLNQRPKDWEVEYNQMISNIMNKDES